MVQRPSDRDAQPHLAGVMERNIQALLEKRRKEEEARSVENRIADRITRFTGSMKFVYLHLLTFGLWIVVNLGWLPVQAFDPTFVILAMVASVEAIFLSTFVLITQNRQAEVADKRADLDLQITLLAEHEITRLITLVIAIAERMNIEMPDEPELAELSEDVSPEKVLDTIESKQKEE
jgi:uncharacterized membrane protein